MDLRLLVALGAAEVVDSPVVAHSAQVVDSTDSADSVGSTDSADSAGSADSADLADPDVHAASLQVWSNETESR